MMTFKTKVSIDNLPITSKENRAYAIRLLSLTCTLFILCLSGCAKSKSPPSHTSAKPAQELYLKSQKKLVRGDYEEAYYDYQQAVVVEPSLANASHLWSILYAWVISQSEAEDVPLLNAQKQVLLKPQQFALRRELLLVAVDKEKDIIHAFGLGVAPKNILHPGQKRLLAREAALTDAYAWVARLAIWTQMGVEGSFDVSRTVVGVQTLKELWIGETIYVVKVQAPLKQNAL